VWGDSQWLVHQYGGETKGMAGVATAPISIGFACSSAATAGHASLD
jgi:hypothetical protein